LYISNTIPKAWRNRMNLDRLLERLRNGGDPA
jgi:hypothetical protein